MSIEQKLRHQLQRDAAAVQLPARDPERAARRSHARGRHRRLAAAGVAVATAAAVAAPPLLRDTDDPSVSISPASEAGLLPTGPLDLDWQVAEGGLSGLSRSVGSSMFQDDQGVVFALSTGPGVRYEDHPEGDYPRALYRLSEDGTWEPVLLDGERPRASDVSEAGGLLYAVSTGPASGGDGVVARLSTSEDGGQTWTSEDVTPVDPPSTTVAWDRASTMAIESNAATTLALVTTSFYPDQAELFPELAADDQAVGYLGVEYRDEGLVLVRYPMEEVRSIPGNETFTAPPPTAPPSAGTDTAPPPTAPPSAGSVAGDEVDSTGKVPEVQGEDVRTISWSDLGVDGPEAVAPRHQLFRQTGDAWEPLPIAGGGFEDLEWLDLGVAGERFVALGWASHGGETTPTVLTSSDGTSWSPVSVPADGRVVGVGPALVNVPWSGTVIHVSGDAGATWSEVDLTGAGAAQGSAILGADGGPLGLALVLGREDSTARELAVTGDLADWTVTPLADIVGSDAGLLAVPFVGEDRIVVVASQPSDDPSQPTATKTAVGTPVR
jgi:hypothetical protein